MIRKREPHWQSAAERARVAAELIEEAESLTTTGGIATPAEVDRDRLPPPLRLELPPPAPPAPPAPPPPPASSETQNRGSRSQTQHAAFQWPLRGPSPLRLEKLS